MVCWQGGTEIKSEEMTVGIREMIDKEADAACST